MAERELSPQAARRKIEDVGGRVRSAARWHGWMWLTIAILTPVFLLAVLREQVPDAARFWIAVGFAGAGAVLTIWDVRRGVVGRQTRRVDRPATLAYIALMMVVAVVILLGESGTSPWHIPLALAPSVPCLVAAWRVLRE